MVFMLAHKATPPVAMSPQERCAAVWRLLAVPEAASAPPALSALHARAGSECSPR